MGGRGVLLTSNLPQLQNLIKRDPAGYKEEFLQQWNHYDSIRQIFQINPDEQAQHFRELVSFISQVRQQRLMRFGCSIDHLRHFRSRNVTRKKRRTSPPTCLPFFSRTMAPLRPIPEKLSFKTLLCCGTRMSSRPSSRCLDPFYLLNNHSAQTPQVTLSSPSSHNLIQPASFYSKNYPL